MNYLHIDVLSIKYNTDYTTRKEGHEIMRKSVRTIGVIVTMGIILVCAHFLNTAQAEPVTEITKAGKTIEAMRNEYADTSSQASVTGHIHMRKVTRFMESDYGLQLYFDDGTGYWLER